MRNRRKGSKGNSGRTVEGSLQPLPRSPYHAAPTLHRELGQERGSGGREGGGMSLSHINLNGTSCWP